MMSIQDVVQLRLASGSDTSIRFLLTSAMIEALTLKAGDLIQVFILGIFKDPNQADPISINIPMVGRVIKAGGSSLGMTVKQNLVKRLDLQENYDLLIKIEKLGKSST
ncbi:MAG: hypothetical protein ACFFCV_11570 [Promethearchaeota archaeon]